MPTNKKRINVTPPKQLYLVIQQLADQDDVPVSTKALQLLGQAVDLEEVEDEFLSAVADKRLGDGSSYVPDSDDIWK